MATALVLALALSLQGPETITYTGLAKPVGTVLDEIAKTSGLEFETDPTANREIVLVSVKNMPLKLFLERLAMATSCEWARDDGAWVLKPNEGQRSKEADQEFAARTKFVASSIDKAIKAGFNQSQGVITYEAIPNMTITTEIDPSTGTPTFKVVPAPPDKVKPPPDPGQTVLTQILSHMDPAEIAAIELGGRRV